MFKENIAAVEDLPRVAQELLLAFPGERIFLMQGQMGAGKTTFIKAICRALGVADNMSSPTYSIVNEYTGATDVIYHFDLYRVKSVEECMDMGFEEYVNSGNYCFIEWPEIAMPLMPEQYVEVHIKPEGENRSLTAQLKKS